MRRARWLIAAAVVVTLPLLAVATAVAVIDPDDYKPQIAEAVLRATGRTLTLEGRLRISPSLWPTIEISNVKLQNLPGGSRADMARAEQIRAELSLPALLSGQVEIAKLTLIGPNILFEVVGGQPNWVFQGAAPEPPGASRRLSLKIRNIHVKNGMVTRRTPARTNVIGIQTLDYHQAADGAPLTIATRLVYADNAPFDLKVAAKPASSAGQWLARLDAAGQGATAAAEGTMGLAGNYDVEVTATIPALEKLNALLPELQLPAIHGASLATHLRRGPVPDDLPIIGATQAHFATVDLHNRIPGLALGPFDLARRNETTAATVSAAGQIAGQPFTASGSVGVPVHLVGPAKLPITLGLRATSDAGELGDVAATGTLALDTLRFAGLDAELVANAPALAAFRPATSPALPALTGVVFKARMQVLANMAALHLPSLSLASHEADATGDLTVGLGPQPALSGRIHATHLDLDAAISPLNPPDQQPPPGTRQAGESPGVIPDKPLAWSALRGPALDISASASEVTWLGQVLHDVDLELALKDSRLRISRLSVGFPGGPLTLALAADATTDAGSVNLDLHGAAIPLAALTKAAGLPGPATGSVQVNAKLAASGSSLRKLASTLDGSLAATMTNGTVSNAAATKLLSGALDALGIRVPAEGETAIQCLGITGSFAHGVGRFPTIAIGTTYLELSGAGETDLGQETVGFKLNPMAEISGSRVSVPVLVTGPFRHMEARLDTSGLDKVGLLIDALFGGDRPTTCVDAGLAVAAPKKD